MQPYVKRTQCDYSLSFKLSVVRQIERGEMTYTQAARHYGIQSKGTVLNWMHKHSSDDWRKLGVTLTERAASLMNEPPSPEQRIKALETQLLAAQQKAQLFEAMVDVIRKQYPQVIVKKSLGKLSMGSRGKKP
jgi:transposase-like protein